MACTLTGCVAAAPLSGKALLFGHDAADAAHDHAGITVSVDLAGGAGTVTAITGADGAWTMAVPAGTYTVTYRKPKYFDASTANVAVTLTGAAAPDVTLTHYRRENSAQMLSTTGNFDVSYSPDRATVVENGLTSGGQALIATRLDGAHDSVLLGLTPAPPGQYLVANDRLVYTSADSVWSVPLDGSAAPVLLATGPATPPGAIAYTSVVGQPGTYTLIQELAAPNGAASFWVARTDGSLPLPSTPAFTTTTFNGYGFRAFTDGVSAIILTENNVGASTVHRIDLATNTSADLNVGVPFYSINDAAGPTVSPDGKQLYFTGSAGISASGKYHYRGLVLPITGATLTSAPMLAPITTVNDELDDQCYSGGWLADSSAYVFHDCATAGVRVWPAGADASVPVAGSSFPPQPEVGPPGDPYFAIRGSYALYLDNQYALRIVDRTGAQVTLEASPENPSHGLSVLGGTGESGDYLVAIEASPAGGTTPARVVAATITTSPLAATTTQLGGAPAGTCQFASALVGTMFYALCSDTGVLNAFAKGSGTPTAQISNVATGLVPISGADRIGFMKTDGIFYSAANATIASPPVVLSQTGQMTASTSATVKDWILFRDPVHALVRASRVDGSTIDEPLFACDAFWSSTSSNASPRQIDAPPSLDPTGTILWTLALECATEFEQTMTPIANLP